MTDRKAMEQALEALGWTDEWRPDGLKEQAIAALRERLAQPEQEPFGYFQYDPRLDAWVQNREGRPGTPFYTTPPQRKPLTDEEIDDIWADCSVDWDDTINVLTLARAIEAAHGIKGEA